VELLLKGSCSFVSITSSLLSSIKVHHCPFLVIEGIDIPNSSALCLNNKESDKKIKRNELSDQNNMLSLILKFL